LGLDRECPRVKPESLSICAALESVSIRLRHSITVSRRVVKKPDNPKGQRLSSRPPGVATPPVDSCHPDARRDPQRDNPSNTPSAETILAAGIFARATERPALNDNEEGVVTLPLGVVIPTPGGIPVEIINQADRLLKRSSPQGFFARATERPALNDNEEGVVTPPLGVVIPPLGVVIPTPGGISSETTLPTHRLLKRSSPQGFFARATERPALNDNEEGVVTPPLGVVIPTPGGIPSETTLPTNRLLKRFSPQGFFARATERPALNDNEEGVVTLPVKVVIPPLGVITPPVDSCHPDARRDPQRDNPSNRPSAETILAAGILRSGDRTPGSE
jgi:hypothetical protein